MTEILVALDLIAEVVAAHELGFLVGSLFRSADELLDRRVTLVRASTAAVVAFLIGFAFSGAAMGRRFSRLDSVYGVVLAVALWMTIDLDYPGIGVIGLSNGSFVETLAAMR